MLATEFTRVVRCQVPIQQAGMGGVAGPRLAAAVAAAGALGMIGGVMVPAAALAAMLDSIAPQYEGKGGAVGVNFLMPFVERDAVAAAASRARVVEFFYAEPDPSLVELVHAGGALACWQVGSCEEAVAAARAGCDLIVAQGVEAGGHVRGQIALLPLLAQVLDAVSVPVIAAGGIGEGRAMAAALAAGAAAVRVGTRFVAAEESDAHPEYVRRLIAARAEDTVLTEAFSVMWPHAPHRVLRSCVEAAERFEGDAVGEMEHGGQRMPVPRFSAPSPTRTTRGAIDAMALYAGETVGAVQGVKPAREIVAELLAAAEDGLRHSRVEISAG